MGNSKLFFICTRPFVMTTTVAFEASLVTFTTFCNTISSAITLQYSLTSTNTVLMPGVQKKDTKKPSNKNKLSHRVSQKNDTKSSNFKNKLE